MSDALAVRRVEEWDLYEDARERWVKDLDLAERVGKGQPRNIRPVIKKLIGEWCAPIGDGQNKANSSEVLSARGACANEASEKTTIYQEPPPKQADLPGARATRARIRAQKVIVPAGRHGQLQETTEYYLNEAAALEVIRRMRTPLAVEITRSIVRSFVMALSAPLSPTPVLDEARAREIVAETLAASAAAPQPPSAAPARLPAPSKAAKKREDALRVAGDATLHFRTRAQLGIYVGDGQHGRSAITQLVVEGRLVEMKHPARRIVTAELADQLRRELAVRDNLDAFIAERLDVDATATIAASDLYEAYYGYVQSKGGRRIRPQAFKGELLARVGEHGAEHLRKSDGRVYRGLRLR